MSKNSKKNWVIEVRAARTYYLKADGNGDRSWTDNPCLAEVFESKAAADQFISSHLSGDVHVVEHTPDVIGDLAISDEIA